MNTREIQLQSFGRLLDIMDDLRTKCPWDMKQTMQSLRHLTIEETYELGDAILDNDLNEVKKELGDLLLHIVFYAKIGAEQNQFTLDDVINGVCEKLIYRHPHIYGDVKVENDEDVKRNWEQIKMDEGKKSVLSGVPVSLPAMVKAMRIQDKAKQVGFEWSTKEQVWDKIEEEKAELLEAVASGNSEINYVRYLNVDAENALELTNKKFIKRFTQMEEKARQENRDLKNMSLEEMDKWWNEIKIKNKSN